MNQEQQERIIIFDTTLRDGEQCPGATLNVDEKLLIAKQLARLGVDVIEAGFAYASPGDFEAVKKVAEAVGTEHGPVICSLARAIKNDIKAAAESLKPAVKGRIHTFISTSDIHLEYQLKKTRAYGIGNINCCCPRRDRSLQYLIQIFWLGTGSVHCRKLYIIHERFGISYHFSSNF